MSFSVRSGLMVLVMSIAGCMPFNIQTFDVEQKLQLVSAGYTGCEPGQNLLSNIKAGYDGGGSWNATCKDKKFLCTAIGQVDGPSQFHCAAAAQP